MINQIRNTVKTIYRTEKTGDKGKSIDLLNLDSKVGGDLIAMFANLSKYWEADPKWKPVDMPLNSYTNLFRFLETYGEISIPELAKKEFIKNAGGNDIISEDNRKILENTLFKQSITILSDEEGLTREEKDSAETAAQKYRDDPNKEVNITNLLKLKYRYEVVNIITQAKSFEGDSWPTMAIANIGLLFNNLVATDVDKKSIFAQYPSLVNGMEVLAEVVNDDSSKQVSKFNQKEAFKLAFIRNFIMSGVNENKYFIQPFNYSDKSKILALSVNSDTKLEDIPIQKMSIEDIKNQLFERQEIYYTKLISQIYSDFDQIGAFGKKKATSVKDRIEQIEKFLKGKKRSDLIHNVPGLELTEELHYSIYKDGIRLNELIKANALIYSNKSLFEEWSNDLESKLAKFMREQSLSSIPIDQISLFNKTTPVKNSSDFSKILGDTFNIVPTINEVTSKVGDSVKVINELSLVKNGELSDIVKKYLWTKNLIGSQYENLSVKGSYLHPAKSNHKTIDFTKSDWFKTWSDEENKRTVAFTKRMVIIGASMTIFNKGASGLLPSYKIAVFDDLTAQVFNPTGNIHKQDTYDGAIPANPFFVAQTISALPGMNLNRVQKPIGTSIKDFHSTFLKCATFGLNNELIRSSSKSERNLDLWMKKMNNIDLFEGTPENLFQLKTLKGETEPIVLPSDLYIPYKGEYLNVLGVEWKGGNNYTINLENSLQKDVTIKNLYDMWQAFGGAFSARKSGNRIVYTEGSIDFVNSVIKKHALNTEKVKDGIDLRDKMIAMFAMKSAVKNGAGNINASKLLESGNEDAVQTIDFNTDYFGIQLDAGHEADESTVSEITQVMSAVSENNFTPELFNDLYQSISNIVESSLKSFNALASKDQIKELTKMFVKELRNSSQTSNSKSIVEAIYKDGEAILPLSNPTIYAQFISSVISRINTDYIRRKFSGAAMVLHPSQGMFKIFESKNGKTYIYEDLINKIKPWENGLKKRILEIENNPLIEPSQKLIERSSIDIILGTINTIRSSEDLKEPERIDKLIDLFLSNSDEFTPSEVSMSEINPLDNISLDTEITINGKIFNAGDTINLSNIQDYYAVKRLLAGYEGAIKKLHHVSRDLKPVEITIEDSLGKKSNIFDTDAISSKYILNSAIDKINRESKNEDFTYEFHINELFATNPTIKYFVDFLSENNPDFKIIYANYMFNPEKQGEYFLDILGKYMDRWIQRSFDVLSINKRYPTVSELAVDTGNPFDVIFKYEIEGDNKQYLDNLKYGFSKTYYFPTAIQVLKTNHKDAEKIIPKKFRSEFLLSDYNHADINQSFFKQKVKEKIKPAKNSHYDIFLSSYKSDSKLHLLINSPRIQTINGKLIIDGNEVGRQKFMNISEVESYDKNGNKKVEFERIGSNGYSLYKVPKNAKLFVDNKGTEMIIMDSIEEASEFVNNSKKNFNFIQINDLYERAKNKATVENDSVIKLYDSIIAVVGDFQTRKYLGAKKTNYIDTKAKVLADPSKGSFSKLIVNDKIDNDHADFVA